MKYNSIGEQLIAKAQELDPNYKPDKFNDMSEALDVILNNTSGGSAQLYLDIMPYIAQTTELNGTITQEGFNLIQTKLDNGEIIGINMGGTLFNYAYFNTYSVDPSEPLKTRIMFLHNAENEMYLKLTIDEALTWIAEPEPISTGGEGLNILTLNLKNCMNESDYNELVGYIVQKTVIAKTYNITLPDLTDVDIVKFTVETLDGNMNTTFYRNSKVITQFNWLCNWNDDENFIQMVTITGYTDNNVNYIKYNGINSGGDIWLDITPYLNEDMTSLSQEGYDLVSNAFSTEAGNPNNKYVGILLAGIKMFYNEFITSDKTGLNFISNSFENDIKRSMSVTIYNDKSIEIINRVVSSSNKIWYDLYLTNGAITITQEQYNEIKELIDSNSLAGITSKRISDGYFSLIKSLNGTFTFRYLSLTNESNNGDKKYTIFKHEIIIKPDLSVSASSEEKYIPLLTQNLSNQSIISIKTDGLQQNLTVGDGLVIENGALKTNNIPALPSDADTKTYVLKAVNGVLTWSE